jgi:hypothetical protein
MTITNKFISDFFSYKRPHGSKTEQQWIDRFILPRLGSNWFQDAVGNFHLDLRDSMDNRTLFVAHVDTVHHDAGRQKVSVGKDNVVRVVDGDCLGADDGAGVLVLLALIEMRVPAYYVFTRCEERGGVGATHLAANHADLLAQFDRAIAFDRKGTSSVITHQGWGRCCSDEFAYTLSDLMSYDELMYAPDDGGVYTDTAEFVNIIPECTNISVGYLNEHTVRETLDLTHLKALINCAIALDWDSLPVVRDATVVESYEQDIDWLDRKNMFVGSDTYTDFNSDVYQACELALDGAVDELLYMMSEAVNPSDPEEVYEQVWHAVVPESLIFNCMRQVDHATDDEQTTRALIDLHNALMYSETYH